jgi:triosephosphate isomerase (TIM)
MPNDINPRKFWVGGNWKCNPTKLEAVNDLISMVNSVNINSQHIQVVIAPPALFLSHVKSQLHHPFHVACQNCYSEDCGAFTGELSPLMLSSLDIPYVILGHSERRSLFKESDEVSRPFLFAKGFFGRSIIVFYRLLPKRYSGLNSVD